MPAASASSNPVCANRTSVPSPSGTSSTSIRVEPGSTGLGLPGSHPQVQTSRRGRSTSTNSPRATLPEITSTRYSPPGRGSRLAERPIQRVAFSGSTKNSQTVSGRAAIVISRRTAVSVLASILLPFLEFRLALQRLEPHVPELLEELPDRREAVGSHAVHAPGSVAPLLHQSGLLQDGQVLR